MKKCIHCGIEKPLNEFNNHALRRDGKDSRCRQCKSTYNKEHWRIHKDDTPYLHHNLKLPTPDVERFKHGSVFYLVVSSNGRDTSHFSTSDINKAAAYYYQALDITTCSIRAFVDGEKLSYPQSDELFIPLIKCKGMRNAIKKQATEAKETRQ